MQLFFSMLNNDTTNSDWNTADDKNKSTDDLNKKSAKIIKIFKK